jgi:hypothetical protein
VSIQQEVPPIKLLLISFSTIVVPGNVGSKHRVPESQYLGRGDPALKDYYPAWLDNMADDATLEGSMLDGVVQGAEAVRSVVVTIRSLYDRQQHKFAGPYGDNGFLEDYVAEVRGEPIGCVVLVTRNAAGQTQHVVASYRPRSSLLLFSRLLGEKFAGTPIAEHFAASES